mgnify:CR=1 FL=1|tara:strand:- start:4563 stop:5960 length:1398 start_codon:yes stop_codon:yes gene_type:complete
MQNVQDRQDRTSNRNIIALLYSTIFLVGIAPLPLGSNRPLPAALLAMATGLVLIAWSLTEGKRPAVSLRRLAWPVGLYALVCTWVLLQALPVLPTGWGDPTWIAASKALGTPLNGRFSVNPTETISGFMRLVTYGAIFWLALQLTRRTQQAWTAIRAAAIIGGLYATYGLIVYLAGNETILIYEKWAYKDSLSSTFVNRNSYAAFAGLCLYCSLTVLLNDIQSILKFAAPLRTRLIVLVESLFSKSIGMTLATLTIALSLLLSASRAGVASALIGLAVLALSHLNRKRMKWRYMIATIGVVASLSVAIFSVAGNTLVDRLGEDDAFINDNPRVEIYDSLIAAVVSSPWTGSGFGTFPDVFPAYRDQSNISLVFWDKAHNTYIENAIELGIPAAMFLVASIGFVAFYALRGVITRKRDWKIPAVGLAATALVGTHSLVDFSLQMPAISIFFAFIMGVSVSQSWRRD